MRIPSRPAAVVLLAAASLVLSGCSAVEGLLGPAEPVRDETTGEIVEAAQADAFQLRLGDCLDLDAPEAEETYEVESVPTVPCTEPHDGEVYALTDVTGETYPGEDALFEEADQYCYDQFTAFVGTVWEDSDLDFTYFYPTAQSWKYLDDREVLCIVTEPDVKVTGTLADAQR